MLTCIHNCSKMSRSVVLTMLTLCVCVFILQDTKYYMKDISDGKEKKPVSCVNELQNQAPPSFHYSTDRMCGDDVIINTEASFLIGCQCTDGCRVSHNLVKHLC